MVDGEVTVHTFTGAALERLDAHRQNVHVPPNAGFSKNGARIHVSSTAGRSLKREQLISSGSVENPMSWAELEPEFRKNVAHRIDGDAADEAVLAITNLNRLGKLAMISEPSLG